MAMRVEMNPLEAVYAALHEHGLDGAGQPELRSQLRVLGGRCVRIRSAVAAVWIWPNRRIHALKD
jgi:hypothetical protein